MMVPIDKMKKLMSRFSSAKEFASSNLRGYGAKDSSFIVNYIDANSRTKLDIPRVRFEVGNAGSWYFLHTADVFSLNSDKVIPSGNEDMSKPIVVGLNGWVLDGRHRVELAKRKGIRRLDAYIPASVLYQELMGGSRVEARDNMSMNETVHAKNGRFSTLDSAHLVIRGGEKYRVVRQHRRLVPIRHNPEKWVRFGDHLYYRTDLTHVDSKVPVGGERYVAVSPKGIRGVIRSFSPLLNLDPRVLISSISLNSRTPFVVHILKKGDNGDAWLHVLSTLKSAGYLLAQDVFGDAPILGGKDAHDTALSSGSAFIMKRG